MTAAERRRAAVRFGLFVLLLVVAVVLTVFALGDLAFNGLDLLALAVWALVLWLSWRGYREDS